jgi:hypothetical protein
LIDPTVSQRFARAAGPTPKSRNPLLKVQLRLRKTAQKQLQRIAGEISGIQLEHPGSAH